VPVISTNTGGLPEVNIHGESGFLSDVGDVEDMAKNAVKILETQEIHEQFRKKARERALKFDITHIIKNYEDLYKEMLISENI
jgi:glycosyltransferase involved in cell wall biosynthesis